LPTLETSGTCVSSGQRCQLRLHVAILTVSIGQRTIQYDARSSESFSLRLRTRDCVVQFRGDGVESLTVRLESALALDELVVAINRGIGMVPILLEARRNEWFDKQQQEALSVQRLIGDSKTAVLAMLKQKDHRVESEMQRSFAGVLAEQNTSSGMWELSSKLVQLLGITQAVVQEALDRFGANSWLSLYSSTLEQVLATALCVAFLNVADRTQNADALRAAERGREGIRTAIQEQPMLSPFAVGMESPSWEAFGASLLEQHSSRGVFGQAQSWNSSTLAHPNVTCDACLQSPVLGVRWKCTACDDYGMLVVDMRRSMQRHNSRLTAMLCVCLKIYATRAINVACMEPTTNSLLFHRSRVWFGCRFRISSPTRASRSRIALPTSYVHNAQHT
jgi:hypothetical protein